MTATDEGDLDEVVRRLMDTGRPLGLRLLASAAESNAADVVRVGAQLPPGDLRLVDSTLADVWATALRVAAAGTPPSVAELQAVLIRDGRYAGDHGGRLHNAMLRLASTVAHPQMLDQTAADALGLAYRLRMHSMGETIADAAGAFSETDAFTLLAREGAQIRGMYERLQQLRGAA